MAEVTLRFVCRSLFPEPASQQEFPVAFGAEDRRLDHVCIGEAQIRQRAANLLHGSKLRGLIAHDSTFADIFSPGFELRLDENDDLTAFSLGIRLGECRMYDCRQDERG